MRTRRLVKDTITYSAAQDREDNVLHQLQYYDAQLLFFSRLNENTDWMRRVVTHHLQLGPFNRCHVANAEDWIYGSFNVCVPVMIDGWNQRKQPGHRVLLRFPLPYRVGEEHRPGNGDEKIRCEAGTYAWVQENCPDVPIPRLYGFALSTGESFTQIDHLPILARCLRKLRRRCLSFLGLKEPSCYVPDQITASPHVVGAGYLLIENIKKSQGTMLSDIWPESHSDMKLRANFFRSLSRILLSISRIPLPRIGSFIIDNNGYLLLNNRPLSMEIQMMENEGIFNDISRDFTYTTVESYTADILSIHDNRLRSQLNAVNDVSDCTIQMATLTAMRAVLPAFFSRELRRGPFIFSLTDLHQSNIFVDNNWNITCLIDLEWACSRQIEMVEPPYWLTGKGVDQIDVDEYDISRKELMSILETEEAASTDRKILRLSEVLARTWATGTFWVILALSSPSGLFTIFAKDIYLLFSCEGSPDDGALPFFWTKNVPQFVNCKVSEKAEYDRNLQLVFEDLA
ncbi:hypothetical protein P170DRAFT_454417 [Aspergillus steynii IBT 23096]|uniref:Aminoglycoside phosphotransferase domain-containing protein n=1 Tax=Aspergillus steynii IBT 23096 TaxID=1392250 RepID=A0A2I2GK96_9EURO|nr:uncharacterized protein P170DRAFT_454417 [Aspergillus steynii IBT 23096]PLB53306.1 hypothetical protein P170DRAFT_454417 [Aspergillus steynii IBT 23096]